MSVTIKIGTFHEKEPRELIAHTGYAADWIKHRTKVGDYTLSLYFMDGYLIPMPYWLLFGIDSEIIDGYLYSGFGGVNYSSRAVEKKDDCYHVQTDASGLAKMVADGRVTLQPEWEWLAVDHAAQIQGVKDHSITWAYLIDILRQTKAAEVAAEKVDCEYAVNESCDGCDCRGSWSCPTPARDTKMDGCAHIPGASAEYTAMCGEGQRYGRVEDY